MSGDGEDDDGDEEDGSREESDEDAEEDASDVRHARQTPGSHPLQQSFKAAAGELLKKYGLAPEDAGGLALRTDATIDMRLCTRCCSFNGCGAHS